MTTALFIGRFQPLHKGHLSAISQILKECDKLIIAIGSSQESNTNDNPFTAEERKQMLESVFDNEKISIIFLPDTNNHHTWIQSIEEIKTDIVYTGNELLKSHLKNAKEVKKELFISSSEIRERIRNNREWEQLVPENVYNIFLRINGIQRIKSAK